MWFAIYNEVNVQSWNTKPILVLVGTKLQKLEINCQKFVLGVGIKMLNQLCNICTPIVKVFVLAWLFNLKNSQPTMT